MFERLSKLIKGFLSLFISGLETANPKALLEAEVQALHSAVGNYNKNLARQAGLVERLKMQVERDKKEVDRLTAQASALFNAGQMEAAGRLALQLKSLKTALADNEAQFKQADDLYRNLSQQRDVYVREAQKRIENIKQKLSRAEIAEAQAQLAEIATATSFDLAGSGATLDRLEENLDQRMTDAMGKARVASDAASTGDWKLKAEEEAALEKQALAEFATAMGLAAAPAAAPVQPLPMERDLGPAQGA
ncbi:MAG: PspA/IM30 family protein [Candidatus Xenobium sp.]